MSNANSLFGRLLCFFRINFLLPYAFCSSIRHLLQYFRRSPPTIETRRVDKSFRVLGSGFCENSVYTWFVTITGMFCFLAISFRALSWFPSFLFTFDISSWLPPFIASPSSSL